MAKEPDDRYESAGALARALEEATLRTAGADDVTPYPGLATFTEADAEYFFGREAEVEAVWRRARDAASAGPDRSLRCRQELLPPGGSPALDARGVARHRLSPGRSPVVSARPAVGQELSGDSEALQLLLPRSSEPGVAVELFSRWRRAARTGSADRRPVRGALHSQPPRKYRRPCPSCSVAWRSRQTSTCFFRCGTTSSLLHCASPR